MKKLSMCRICLVEKVGLLVVDNKKLHEVYEKLTGIPFITEDSRPIRTCFDCLNELKQTYQLLTKCLKTDEGFAQTMHKDYETNSSINQDRNEHYSGFIKTPIEQTIVVEACPTESIAIKEELPDVCEELDDIVETKEECQSDEIKAENIDDSCLLDTAIVAQRSESDSENDVQFMEVKIEVEEEDVLKKKQKAVEMIKIKAENIDDSCLLDTDIVAQHSESDSENDVHFKEVKIEVEEEDVSKKIQKAEEMIRATVEKNPKLEPSTPEQDNEIRTEHPEKQKTDWKVIRPSQKLMQEPETQFKEAYKRNQRAKSKIQRTRSQIVIKQYECDVCHRSFNQKYNLTDHIRIHTGERPFKCKVCHRNFTRNSVLKKHIRIHTGEKPYKCDICERSFKQRFELTSHINLHTGAKPYKCDICERSFARSDTLKSHIRIHTGEKPFQCVLCQRSFNQKMHLKDHIQVHTGEKPYKCDICEKSFGLKKNLTYHMRLHRTRV